MIDDKINKSLNELEEQLKDIKSAHEQVRTTVDSFDGLKEKTSGYVTSLKDIDAKLKQFISLVGEDYEAKVASFEKDRASIVKSCNTTIEKVKNVSDEVKEEVSTNIASIQAKLKYSIIINVVLFIVLIIIVLAKM